MTASKNNQTRSRPTTAMGHVIAWIVETDRRYRAVQDIVETKRNF